MDTDLFLVIGLVIAAFAMPSVIGAFSEGRPPRAAAILVMIGGGLIILAVTQRPGGYSFADVPQAFARVVGAYLL